MRQVAEDALDHDHGGVDDDAEIDRPDRKQIGRFPRTTVMITARNSAAGTVAETMIAQRKLPRNTYWMRKISAMPNSRLCSTVRTVMATSSPRS